VCVHQAGLEGLRLLVREQAATIEAKAATIEGQAATIEALRVEQVHSAIYMTCMHVYAHSSNLLRIST